MKKDWKETARHLFNPYARELNFDDRDWEVFLNRLEDLLEFLDNPKGGN